MQRTSIRLGLCAGAVLAGSLCAGTAGAAPLLAVDFNDREMSTRDMTDVNNTAPGFTAFTLSGTVPATGNAGAAANTTQAVGAYSLTVTAVNASGAVQGGIDDRDRTNPSTAPTLNQLYDDFIFTAGGVGAGGGLDIAIVSNGNLLPNTQYSVSVYAYDSDSTPAPQPRSATYLDGNNANALVLNTSFSAANLPTTDEQYKFTGVALTDASGNLLLRARNTTPLTGTTVNIGVILNGLEVNVPEPGSALLLAAGALATALRRRRA